MIDKVQKQKAASEIFLVSDKVINKRNYSNLYRCTVHLDIKKFYDYQQMHLFISLRKH